MTDLMDNLTFSLTREQHTRLWTCSKLTGLSKGEILSNALERELAAIEVALRKLPENRMIVGPWILVRCTYCMGAGFTWQYFNGEKYRDICPRCAGKRTVPAQRIITVDLEETIPEQTRTSPPAN